MDSRKEGEKALVSTRSLAYRILLTANRLLEESRERLGYLDPQALKNYRDAITIVSHEAKETLETQDALLGKKPSISQ